MTASTSAWPGDAPFALCLTHDVDHILRHAYQRLWALKQVTAFRPEMRDWLDSIFRRRNSAWNFEAIMDMEEGWGVKSTFLFLNESAKGIGPKFWGRYAIGSPTVRDIVRTIDNSGWEVGLHGSLESFDNPALLKREKDILENILGKAVTSSRQHYLHISERTFRIQSEAGLLCDSSVGFAAIPYDGKNGYIPYIPGGSSVLELPMTLMDTVDIADVSNREKYIETLDQIRLHGGVLTLNWHQCRLSRTRFPNNVALYADLVAQALALGAWAGTMRDVASTWRRHHECFPQ